MTRVRTWAAAAMAGLVLSGCSMFSSSDPRSDPAPLTDLRAEVLAETAWSVTVGRGGGSGFAPVVVGDAVYAATPDGTVIKVDATTGQTLWRKELGQRLSAGVGADGNIVAVVTADAYVVALNDDGDAQWRVRASSEVGIPPLVGEGIVVVRSGDYRIQAFDARSGDLRWRLQRPGPALALKTNMQMLWLGQLVVTGLPSGKLLAIDGDSGDAQWEGTVALSQGATDLERIIDVVGAPQIQGTMLCAVAYQGQIACFDVSQGGVTRWQQPFSSRTGLGSDASHVYAANTRDIVQAYDLSDGALAWTQDALRNRRLSAPAVIRSAVAFGDLEGYVHLLSRSDGRLLGRLRTGSDAIVSPLTASSHGILVQTQGGQLLLVQTQ